MRCVDIQQLLDEAERPEQPQGLEAEAHLATCVTCREVRAELAALRGELAAMAPPALPEGFELELRRRLAQSASEAAVSRARKPRSRSAVLVAIAAGLLALTAGTILYWVAARSPVAEPVHYRLDLAVRAHQPHPAARFHVELPGGVELPRALSGLSADGRSLGWQSPLEPGLNEVSLPLVLISDAREVRARVTVDGWTGEARVPLKRAARARTGGRQEPWPVALALIVPAGSAGEEALP